MELKLGKDSCSFWDNIEAGWRGGINRILCDVETKAVTQVVNKGGSVLMQELQQLNNEICADLGAEIEAACQPLIAEASAASGPLFEFMAAGLEATLAAVDAAIVFACKKILEKIEQNILDAVEHLVISELIEGLPGCDAVHCPEKTPLDHYEQCVGWCRGCECKSGVCARHWSSKDDSLACCPSENWQNDWAAAYCTGLEAGRRCLHDWQCESYLCENGVCGERNAALRCDDITSENFGPISRHKCDTHRIKKIKGSAYSDYTHCYRDECDEDHNRDYLIRKECACRGMYYNNKWKDCGDWYFSGRCEPYSDNSLLQANGQMGRHPHNHWYKHGHHPSHFKYFERLKNAIQYPKANSGLFSVDGKIATKRREGTHLSEEIIRAV